MRNNLLLDFLVAAFHDHCRKTERITPQSESAVADPQEGKHPLLALHKQPEARHIRQMVMLDFKLHLLCHL